MQLYVLNSESDQAKRAKTYSGEQYLTWLSVVADCYSQSVQMAIGVQKFVPQGNPMESPGRFYFHCINWTGFMGK